MIYKKIFDRLGLSIFDIISCEYRWYSATYILKSDNYWHIFLKIADSCDIEQEILWYKKYWKIFTWTSLIASIVQEDWKWAILLRFLDWDKYVFWVDYYKSKSYELRHIDCINLYQKLLTVACDSANFWEWKNSPINNILYRRSRSNFLEKFYWYELKDLRDKIISLWYNELFQKIKFILENRPKKETCKILSHWDLTYWNYWFNINKNIPFFIDFLTTWDNPLLAEIAIHYLNTLIRFDYIIPKYLHLWYQDISFKKSKIQRNIFIHEFIMPIINNDLFRDKLDYSEFVYWFVLRIMTVRSILNYSDNDIALILKIVESCIEFKWSLADFPHLDQVLFTKLITNVNDK